MRNTGRRKSFQGIKLKHASFRHYTHARLIALENSSLFLCRYAIEQPHLEHILVQVEEIHLNAKKLEHCRACGNGWGTCNKKGTCVIQDDFAGIYKTISEADGIVWISAVYWSEMTECFKAFFDRLRRCDAAHNHTSLRRKDASWLPVPAVRGEERRSACNRWKEDWFIWECAPMTGSL